MSKVYNPFTENITLEYFVGREHQLLQFNDDLKGLIEGIPNHQYIAGVHGAGKTTFLAKLVDIANGENFLAVRPTLDDKAGSRAQISTIIKAVIIELDKKSRDLKLLLDWEKGVSSVYFRHPKNDELNSDNIRDDFNTLISFIEEKKIPGIVICIDEGQRIEGRALSALKNSLQQIGKILLTISVRLPLNTKNLVDSGRIFLDNKANEEAEGDLGASRFYVKGIPIGAFDTDQEAVDCLTLRLRNNAIQFDNDTINSIVSISGRIPRDIIRFSNSLYNKAQQLGVDLVDVKLLNLTFKETFSNELSESVSLITELSDTAKKAILGLINSGNNASIDEIFSKVHQHCPLEYQEPLKVTLKNDLDRIIKLSTICTTRDEQYLIQNPVHSYALKLLTNK
jgi:hypothetical protein